MSVKFWLLCLPQHERESAGPGRMFAELSFTNDISQIEMSSCRPGRSSYHFVSAKGTPCHRLDEKNQVNSKYCLNLLKRPPYSSWCSDRSCRDRFIAIQLVSSFRRPPLQQLGYTDGKCSKTPTTSIWLNKHGEAQDRAKPFTHPACPAGTTFDNVIVW